MTKIVIRNFLVICACPGHFLFFQATFWSKKEGFELKQSELKNTIRFINYYHYRGHVKAETCRLILHKFAMR